MYDKAVFRFIFTYLLINFVDYTLGGVSIVTYFNTNHAVKREVKFNSELL